MMWRGRELNPPLVIITRLAVWPIIQVLRVAICLCLLVAWGKVEAADAWQNLS